MKIFSKLCLIFFAFATALFAQVQIDISAKKQVIRGFGGMNHPQWAGDLTAAQRETVFGNGNNQLGFTVLRIPVPEEQSAWSGLVATAKYAYERGYIVFASPWNPPSGMTETFTHSTDNTSPKRLKASSYAAYATHLNDFVTYMKNNGVNLYAISVQNEPDYANEWTWWTPAEMVTFLRNNASSINCKIIAPESFQYTKKTSDSILNDAQALANIDILGTHLYGTQVSQFPYPLFKQKGDGKELWMTEVYVPNSTANSSDTWPEALDVAQHIHNAMVEAEFQMYVWWYIRRSYSPLKEDGTIGKRGWMMAHFSKFVRPGYIRIDATKNPQTNVFVSAYISKGSDSVAIVAVNKSTSAVNQSFTISSGTALTKMEGWRTTGSANMAKITDNISVSGGSFTASLPAQSVTTFVGTMPSSSSNISVTCNVNNLEPSYISGSSVPRPNVICSTGEPGIAKFRIGTSAIDGWDSPGGTHALYNIGTRAVTLSNIKCSNTEVTLNPAISCGIFEITENTTSIASHSPLTANHSPIYYSIKGEPLGSTKPQKAGIYIVKQGSSVQKIAVK